MLLAAAVALDAVLADLGPARAAALRHALAADGVPLGDAAAARAATAFADGGAEVGVRAALAAAAGDAAPDDAAAAALGGDETAVALLAHRAERALGDRLRHGGTALAPGAREAVDALAARLRLAVVTSLPRADARLVLDAAGLAPAFSAVIAADDRPRPGEPAERWARAFARLAGRTVGLTADRVAALMASRASAAAARAAGFRTVWVGPAPGAADADAAEAEARVATLVGLTPTALACALDLAPDARAQPVGPSPGAPG